MKRSKAKASLVMVLISVMVLLGFSVAWCAQKTIEWRFYSPLPDSRMETEDMKAWAKRIYERSGERLKITVYPGGALGFKPTEVLRVMQAGVIESSHAYDEYFHRDEPVLGGLIVQGIYYDFDDYKKTADLMREVKKKTYAKWGMVWVAMAHSFGKLIYVNSKEPISSLKEMKGKKLRVWSKDQADTFKKLGVTAQIIPQEDMYIALKTGVVDCALYPPTAVKAMSLYEVVRYASPICPYTPSLGNYIVSKSAWAGLSEDLKKVVLEAGDWVFEETGRKYGPDEKYEEIIKFLKEKGMTFLSAFPEEDRKLVRKAAFEVWESVSKNAGPEAVGNFNKLKEALSK